MVLWQVLKPTKNRGRSRFSICWAFGLTFLLSTGFFFFFGSSLLFRDDLASSRTRIDECLGHRWINFQLLGDHFHPNFFDIEDADHAEGSQAVGGRALDAFGALDHFIQRFQALGELVWGQDVQVPSSQPCGQTNILPTAANGQRQLVFSYDNSAPSKFEAQAHFFHLSGLQGVCDEHLTGLIPSHNVDFLAPQLIDDVPDSRSSNADTGPNRIDFGIDRSYGNFGAETRLTAHGSDFDHAFRDFRNFKLEQPANKLLITSGKHNFDLGALLSNIQDQTTYAVTVVELFARDLLRPGHKPFSTVDLHDQGTAFNPLHGSGDDLTFPLPEISHQGITLILTEALNHHLLGRLGRNTAQIFQSNGFRPYRCLGIIDVVVDVPPHRDLSGQWINATSKFLNIKAVEVLASRTLHGLFKVLEKQVAVDVAILGNGIEQSDHVGWVHGRLLTERCKLTE